MAVLTVQALSQTAPLDALLAVTAAAGGGDSFVNTGVEILFIYNTNSDITLTVDAPGTCSLGVTNHAAHDIARNIANSTTHLVGPFPIARFGASVALSYSGVTGVLVAVFRPST